jgi:prevent-host-death family protein
MSRSVSATEAKNRLGALLSWVVEENDEVIIEHQGKPRAVLMSTTEFEKVQDLRKQARRAEAIATIRRLRDEISARNSDMTPEEVEEFANRVRHDAVESLIKKGKVRFES